MIALLICIQNGVNRDCEFVIDEYEVASVDIFLNPVYDEVYKL